MTHRPAAAALLVAAALLTACSSTMTPDPAAPTSTPPPSSAAQTTSAAAAPAPSTTTPAAVVTKTVAPPPAATTAAPAGDSDNGWTLVGTPHGQVQFGMLTVTARVRNDQGETHSAFLQLTYDPDGANPIVCSGAVNDVAGGKTVTVTLLGSGKVDKVPAGKPEFRVTAST